LDPLDKILIALHQMQAGTLVFEEIPAPHADSLWQARFPVGALEDARHLGDVPGVDLPDH
jgi:hypothetical protein